MAGPAAAQAALCDLRHAIARIEGRLAERLDLPADGGTSDGVVLRRAGLPARMAGHLPTGAKGLDAALGGGLPLAAMTEIHGSETRDAGAAAGFALALAARAASAARPLLWVATHEAFAEAGGPYAPGIMHRFGIGPKALLFAETRRLEDALWVAEEAAALAALSCVLLEVRGAPRKLDLTATRRLHRRTQATGRPLYLLRQAGLPEPTAAPVRLVVAPAPAAERHTLSGPLAGSIGPPAFAVTVSRNRLAAPATFILEWNRDERAFHERRSFPVAAQDHGAMVSASAGHPHPAGKAGSLMAFRRRA